MVALDKKLLSHQSYEGVKEKAVPNHISKNLIAVETFHVTFRHVTVSGSMTSMLFYLRHTYSCQSALE